MSQNVTNWLLSTEFGAILIPVRNQTQKRSTASGLGSVQPQEGAQAASSRIDSGRIKKPKPKPRGWGPLQRRDIIEVIPPNGITVADIMAMFRHRVGGHGTESKRLFLELIKTNCTFGEDKLLRPRRG